MNTQPLHIPVLLDECLDALAPAIGGAGAVVVDGTLGLGGHTAEILNRYPHATVVGIDRDPRALTVARERLREFGDRFVGVHTTYDRIADALASANRRTANGILLDLGVSSMQIDEADRGFAYSVDAPLDMRMDQSGGTTAAEILRDYAEGDLIRIFREYGEEKKAKAIAKAIEKTSRPQPRSSPIGWINRPIVARIPMASSTIKVPIKIVRNARGSSSNCGLGVAEVGVCVMLRGELFYSLDRAFASRLLEADHNEKQG
jgi:16S rRNA (cytosine1402-N4)-methyltransferase